MIQRRLALLATIGLTLVGGGCGDHGTTPTGNDLATVGDMAGGGVGDMATGADMAPGPMPSKKVIVFVWDGLRPDSITQTDTPNLYALKMAGTNFSDNHSTYPTFTMMNSAAFATGSFPQTTGFYGNSLWAPGAMGGRGDGTTADFVNPIFTEDYAILQDLDAYYNNKLLLVGTLFQAAQAKGLKTAAVGKNGAAFLQDYKKGGYIIDESAIFPLSLVKEIQAAGDVIPANTKYAYPAGEVTLSLVNGTPTASGPRITLADNATSNPTDKSGAPPSGANLYLMQTYLRYVLPKAPDLTLIWFRSPDSPQHQYGPGTANYKAALASQDFLLGQLQQALKDRGWDKTTDLVIVSDHGHSTVSGSLALFPLRAIKPGTLPTDKPTVGDVDPNGYSVSGDVRLADILFKQGFTKVADGNGCLNVPVMSGVKADGNPVYMPSTDTDGTACKGTAGTKYTTGYYKVAAGTLPTGYIVIVPNGGSDYLYVVDHDATTVTNVVKLLQQREEIGAIFVHSQYGAVPGTLPMNMVKLEVPTSPAGTGRAGFLIPDIMVSYNYDETAMVAGFPGIEYESMSSGNNRGMHGSFSPIDVHNTLIAAGPDFKTQFVDSLPTGNVDVAPTVASVFGLSLPGADGRPLLEALASGGAETKDYTAAPSTVNPATAATGLQHQLPTDPTGATKDTALTVGSYSIDLKIKTLTKGTQTWTYFDSAKAVRQ